MCACAPLLMLAGIGQAVVVDIGLDLSQGSGADSENMAIWVNCRSL